MQNFVVSARKYRPSTFETVVGQSHITTTLKNAILTQHLAQAFLFCGPRGVGKTTCARILAKTINCEQLRNDGEACGTCPSCLSYQNNNSFNIHELDAASNNSVDDIRNLNDQVRIPPQYGSYKVYIIDEVHMLTTQAFNAFLKTLEEPPRYAVFILATTEKHKILPTILSRCQIFDFNRIRISDISSQLARVADAEGIGYEDEGLRVIAQKADGGMRDALSMFDMISTFSQDRKVSYAQVIANLHILDSDYYFKMTQDILKGNGSGLLLAFDEILQMGFDGHHFLVGLAQHFRDLLICSDPATLSLLDTSEDKKKQYLDQASAASGGLYLNLLSMASATDLQYKNSKNQRLLVELCLLKMANLNAVLASKEAEKKKRSSEPAQALKVPAASVVVRDTGFQRMPFKPLPRLEQLSKPSKPSDSKEIIELNNSAQETKGEKRSLLETGMIAAKAAYLDWSKENLKYSVSLWVLALEEFSEGSTVYLSFANDMLEEDFHKEKPTILRFFTDHFDRSPVFETSVIKTAVSELKPYTNAEKFNYLARKFPDLQNWRARLMLDVN
jgi:DNA polymerase-3 subunit gamma/tau